jgi:hypothetical protein
MLYGFHSLLQNHQKYSRKRSFVHYFYVKGSCSPLSVDSSLHLLLLADIELMQDYTLNMGEKVIIVSQLTKATMENFSAIHDFSLLEDHPSLIASLVFFESVY